MKKYLLLLLFTTIAIAQNPTRFPYGVQITGGQTTETSPTQVTTTTATGLQGKADPANLPVNISPQPLNYSITSNKLGEHLKGIDNRFGQIVQTTAGITNRIYFTADDTTVNSVIYFASSGTGKGTNLEAIQTVSNNDNIRTYFSKDVISIAQPSAITAPSGTFSGQLSVRVSDNSAQERFGFEIYKTNNLGVPISSGIIGAPLGSLGVTVVAILDSGIIDLDQDATTNITVSGQLLSTLTLNTGERLRYHVYAEKVGTVGAEFTFSLYYGSNHSSYYDVPVSSNTDTTLNKSLLIPGITTTDALNNISVNKQDVLTDANLGSIIDGLVYKNTPMDGDGFLMRDVLTGEAVEVPFSTVQPKLGYTPENISNKQNSLTPDGTGQKYTTVDAVITHTTNTSNPHSVTKSQVGLSNVDNTSDLNKPISTATQTALNLKANTSDLSQILNFETRWNTGDSQTFTLPDDAFSIISVTIQGISKSEDRYTLPTANTVTILDTIYDGNFVQIVYATNSSSNLAPYYTQSQVDFLIQQKIADAKFGGSITTASTPLVTGNAYWITTEPGTYTNFGNVVVPANSIAVISRTGEGFSVSSTIIDLSEYQKKVDATYILGTNSIDLVNNNLEIISNQAINSLNEIYSVTLHSAYRNINIANYTKDSDIEIEYEGCRTTASSGSAFYLLGGNDTGILFSFPTLVGTNIKEKIKITIPKGTTFISTTFIRPLDYGVGLRILNPIKKEINLETIEDKVFGTGYFTESNSGVVTLAANTGYSRSRFLKVNSGETYYITGYNSSNHPTLVGFPINTSSNDGVSLLGSGIYENYPVVIPHNVNYIRLASYTSKGLSIKKEIINKLIDISMPTPVAHWDFTEPSLPYISKIGGYELELGSVNAPERIEVNRFGGGIRFTGSQFLKIPNNKTGNLNIGKYSKAVTLVAWIVKPNAEESNSYIAGMWKENNDSPSRMYGMFTHLPGYGARNQVIGHISRYGGASPGLIYSRDLSITGDSIEYDKLEMCAITYDGKNIISYRNGLADRVTDINEGTPNPGITDGSMYNRNPYDFTEGLNRSSISDFTVGAVELTGGMSNYFKGDIAELMVYDTNLTTQQLMNLHLSRKIDDNILNFNFNRPISSWSNELDLWRYGWNNIQTSSGIVIKGDVGSWRTFKYAGYKAFGVLNNNTKLPAMLYKDFISSEILDYSFIKNVQFTLNNTGSSIVRFCLKIKDIGWISSSDFEHEGNASSTPTIDTETIFNINFKEYQWYRIGFIPNKEFIVTNEEVSLRQSDIIENFGVAVISADTGSIIRVTDINFYRGN